MKSLRKLKNFLTKITQTSIVFLLQIIYGRVACLNFGYVSELGHVTHPCTRNFTFSPNHNVRSFTNGQDV